MFNRHLQTCKAVVNILIMGSVLRQSLMVVPTTGIFLYAQYISLHYNSAVCI